MTGAASKQKGGETERAMTRRSFLQLSLTASSLFFSAIAGSAAYRHLSSRAAYAALAKPEGRNGGTAGEKRQPDWDDLLAQNPNTVGWLHVKGTSIDTPIVTPGGNEPEDWYLTHDFWGQPDPSGCPYLDRRCAIDGRHVLAYGHNQANSNTAFSSIHQAHQPDVFATIGDATLSTPSENHAGEKNSTGNGPTSQPPAASQTASASYTPRGTNLVFRPILSLKVEAGYKPIQRFGVQTTEDMQSLIDELRKDANVVARDIEAWRKQANRLLTLITCANSAFATKERTVLVFCSP